MDKAGVLSTAYVTPVLDGIPGLVDVYVVPDHRAYYDLTTGQLYSLALRSGWALQFGEAPS